MSNNKIEIECDSSSDSDNEAMNENYIELAKGFNDLMEKMKTKSKLTDAKITKNELEQMEDYYERQIQMRSMHIQTLTIDNKELKEKSSQEIDGLKKRILCIRNKCLVRKFQSRFWTLMTVFSQLEIWIPGFSKFLVFRVIDPTIYEIIWGQRMISGLSRLVMIGYLSHKVSDNYDLVGRVKKFKNLLI
jgi:hypothetical protein